MNGICNVQWNLYRFSEDVNRMILEYLNITGFANELGPLILNNDVADHFKRDKSLKKREVIIMQTKIANKRLEDLKFRKKIEPVPMYAENLLT